jgi:haloalkane dehalogenase
MTSSVRCHVVDLPGTGDSRFSRATGLGVADHAQAVAATVDALGLTDLAVVGHDSGGLIARHALAGDPRVRAWGLIDSEQPQGATWRFRMFLAARYAPGFERVLAWAVGNRRVRRHELLLGGCFADRTLLDGEFDEFFLRPLQSNPERRWAAGQFARSFDLDTITALGDLHPRIRVPVALVYGERNSFFPLAWSEQMVSTFAGPAALQVIPGGRLFTHEEFPDEVADALLPTLRGEPAATGR